MHESKEKFLEGIIDSPLYRADIRVRILALKGELVKLIRLMDSEYVVGSRKIYCRKCGVDMMSAGQLVKRL